MALAKALGGGFPIGACLATAEAAAGMTPGSHGSTFGGNPLAVAAANAVLDVMLKPGFFEHAQKMSLLLKQKLASVVDRHPDVLSEVRGEGLLIGLKAVVPSGELVDRAARGKAVDGRRRRERRALAAAADRQRGGDRGVGAAAGAGLRQILRRIGEARKRRNEQGATAFSRSVRRADKGVARYPRRQRGYEEEAQGGRTPPSRSTARRWR